MQETSVTTSFLRQLKEATNEQHLAMEADPLLTRLLSPALTRWQYICYLSLFLKISEFYESKILPLSTPALAGWQVSAPSQKILTDLETLGLSHPIEPLWPFEFPVDDPDVPFALGFTYVMEGSKLGGKVITRSVAKSLGLTEENGIQYLSDFGQDTFPRWKEFLAQFSAVIIDTNGQEQAIHGANQAFAAIAIFFASNTGLYEL